MRLIFMVRKIVEQCTIFGVSFKTKGEYTNSDYTKWLRKNDTQTYKDKMRVAGHTQDIVYATTGYVNEGLKHTRKDNIVDFARGDILIDVSGRQYSAEVVIGFTKSGICELHDIVEMTPTKFEYKKEATTEAMDSYAEPNRSGVTSFKQSIPQNSKNASDNLQPSLSNKNDVIPLKGTRGIDLMLQKPIAPIGENVVRKSTSENATEITENYANAKSTLAEIDEDWKKNKPSEVESEDDLIENKTLERILTKDDNTESEKNQRKWAMFKANFLDKGMVFEDLSLNNAPFLECHSRKCMCLVIMKIWKNRLTN